MCSNLHVKITTQLTTVVRPFRVVICFSNGEFSGHFLWSTTICITSLFTTGHACFRRLDDQISTNLAQIEQVSKTPNNTFTYPKTGKSHGFSSGFEFVENLGPILHEFKAWCEFCLKTICWQTDFQRSTHRSHGSLADFRSAKRKRRWYDQKLVGTSLFRFGAKMRFQIEIETDLRDKLLVLRAPKYDTCLARSAIVGYKLFAHRKNLIAIRSGLSQRHLTSVLTFGLKQPRSTMPKLIIFALKTRQKLRVE